MVHSFGKNEYDKKLKRAAVRSKTFDSSLVLKSEQKNIEIASSSAVFDGANFNGTIPMNIQINQKGLIVDGI